ncbi:MAG: hypothetical protein V3S00_05580, partial [Dehalococcoidia bacterium]
MVIQDPEITAIWNRKPETPDPSAFQDEAPTQSTTQDEAPDPDAAEISRIWSGEPAPEEPDKVGFWEAATTTTFGEPKGIKDWIPFIATGVEGVRWVEMYQAGEAFNGGTATPDQQDMLGKMLDWHARERSFGGGVGGIAGDLPVFAVEFATGLGIAKVIGKAAMKTAGGIALHKALTKMAKLKIAAALEKNAVTRTAGKLMARGMAGEAVLAITEVPRAPWGRIMANARRLQFQRRFGLSRDEADELTVEVLADRQSLVDVLPTSIIDQVIEFGSEMAGPALPLVGKLDALHDDILAFFFSHPKWGMAAGRAFLRKHGIGGVIEEVGEEYFGAALRETVGALGGAEEFKGALPETFKQTLEMYVAFGLRGGAGAVKGALGPGMTEEEYAALERMDPDEAETWMGIPLQEPEPAAEAALSGAQIMPQNIPPTHGAVQASPPPSTAPGAEEPEAVTVETEQPPPEPGPTETPAETGRGLEAEGGVLPAEEPEGVLERLQASEGLGGVSRVRGAETDAETALVEREAKIGTTVTFADLPEGVAAATAGPGQIVLSEKLQAERGAESLEQYLAHEAVHDAALQDPAEFKRFLAMLRTAAPGVFAAARERYTALRKAQGLEALSDEMGDEEAVAFLAEQMPQLILGLAQENPEALQEAMKSPVWQRIMDALLKLARTVLGFDTARIGRLREEMRRLGAGKLADLPEGTLEQIADVATVLARIRTSRGVRPELPKTVEEAGAVEEQGDLPFALAYQG